ncbi:MULTISPECIES: MFS transporter [Tsukamurella]|uniref:MFS transporter n=2 Tax=Tsukamurella TaxID=2060 RepID=A0A5C5S4Q1_9ACTN|nr:MULTISPECIES: MFS transporter [Tsukamurella]NMD56930.1 MFS transporter [Tsukamurella columbiensis]TWS29832.1 MFS transporter [Tsukamurella conjunctivitidis]
MHFTHRGSRSTVETVTATADPIETAPLRAGTPAYRRTTLALFVAGLTTFGSMYSTQAVLPELTRVFGAAPAVSALAVSVTTGLLALAIIPVSALSERFGRTRVMTVSAVAAVVLGLVIPLAPTLEVLLAFRALQGIALAGVPAVAMAYLAEEVDGRDLGGAMGRYIAGTTIGGLLGRVVTAVGLDVLPWRGAMELFAVAAAVLTVVMIRTLPASRFHVPAPVSVRTTIGGMLGHLRRPALAALFALAFLLMGGFVSVYNFLGFRLLAEPFALAPGVVGLVFLIYLAGTWSSGAAGRLADRIGRRRVLLASIATMGAGLAITLPDSTPAVLAGMVVFTAGFFAAHSVASGWVGLLATAHRAEASSGYLFCYYAGSSVVGAAAGLAYAASGWPGIALAVGVGIAAAFVLVATVLPRSGSEAPRG